MISLKKARKKLQENGEHFTDKQVVEIREILYMLARIDLKNRIRMQEAEKQEKENNNL